MANETKNPATRKFIQHPVHQELEQWRNKLPDERPAKFRELAAEAKGAYTRLRWILRDLNTRLQSLNPLLIQTATLDATKKQLNQLQAPWEQYRNDPKVNWQSLNASTDELLTHVLKLPRGDEAAAWRENLDELRGDMEEALQEAQGAVRKLQDTAKGTDTKFHETNEKLKELTSEIQTQKPRLDQMITQQSEGFNKAEQDRVAQFTKVEQERTAAFSKTQEKQKKQQEAAITDLKTATTTLVETHQKELEAVVNAGKNSSHEGVEKINAQLQKAVEIVGTIVKTSMSGNYQIIANREYKNAWVMRSAAIVSFLLMGGMVIWAVSAMQFGANDIEWRTFAFRLSLGFAFLIPGIYCAKEAARHWNGEKHNRRIALELASLSPFIEKLGEEERKKIIEQKANEYFGRGTSQMSFDERSDLKDIHIRGDQLVNLVSRHSNRLVKCNSGLHPCEHGTNCRTSG